MPIQSDAIVVARASRQLSLSQLSKRTGISVPLLSRIESDQREPSDEEIQLIAKALGYPISTFREALPTGALGLSGMYHRRLKTARVRDVRKVEAECVLATIAIKKLTRWYEFEAEYEFPRFDREDFDGNPTTAAQLVRAQWQLPRGPVKDAVLAIERAGGIVIEREFDIPKMDAIFQFAPGIPPLFWLNRSKPAERVRFSLSHELGHAILHRNATPSDRAEHEANEFAAEFLLPKREFLSSLPGKISISALLDLKPLWRVSAAFMAYRARSLGALTDSQYRYLMVQMSRAGMRTHEPNPVKPTKTMALRTALRRVMTDHGWTEEELANALSMPVDVLLDWIGDVQIDPPTGDQRPRLRIVGGYEGP